MKFDYKLKKIKIKRKIIVLNPINFLIKLI